MAAGPSRKSFCIFIHRTRILLFVLEVVALVSVWSVQMVSACMFLPFAFEHHDDHRDRNAV